VKYAIIETGGKQYKVAEGDMVEVEKIDADAGDLVELDRVLMISDEDGVRTGRPVLEGARAIARVVKHGKGKKILVFKYKPKKNYRRRYGHRQPFTKLLIEEIRVGD